VLGLSLAGLVWQMVPSAAAATQQGGSQGSGNSNATLANGGTQISITVMPHTLVLTNCVKVPPTWSCNVMLSGTNAPSSGISWSANHSTNPTSGTIPQGKSVQVTITQLMCPGDSTIMFKGMVSTKHTVLPDSTTWMCSPTPTPSPSPSPTPKPTPTPTPGGTPAATPTASPTPGVGTATATSTPTATPTVFIGPGSPQPNSTPNGGGGGSEGGNGGKPPNTSPNSTGNTSGGSSSSGLLTIAALGLAVLGFLLYLMSRSSLPLGSKFLALVVPVRLLRRARRP